ncbi:MAG: tRNA uridine-5-carboxymethylaminomethyl(34) synthesis GTPase MnmE [Pseudomonadota bacterium]
MTGAALISADGKTIFAPSTGQGSAAIAVIRISGPSAHDAIERLTARDAPPPRRLTRRAIVGPDGETIDDAMVVTFPEGASFTGEPMAEIQCHGGLAVLDAVLSLLSEDTDCRFAAPGEFTWRAVMRGRMGLDEAEGLGDLIAAETEMQRRQAVRLVSGAVRDRVEGWRERLLRALMLLEVTIDWADEEVPENVHPEVTALVSGLMAELEAERGRVDRAEKLRQGFEVALIGAPNAGKSTLLNCLAGRDAAITSAVPGTTRDIIEVRYDLQGWPILFLDMAGLRHTADDVEREGVRRAEERAQLADLRLYLISADSGASDVAEALMSPGDLRIWTKADSGLGAGDLQISAATGEGIDDLLDAISARLISSGDLGLFTHRRHGEALERALSALGAVENAGADELMAHFVREALAALEQIIGRVGVEDVLDTVFRNFCLGK